MKKTCSLTNRKPNSNLCMGEFWKCTAYNASVVTPKVLGVRNLTNLVEKEIERYNRYLQRLRELFAEGTIDYSTYAYLHVQYKNKLESAKKTLDFRQIAYGQ